MRVCTSTVPHPTSREYSVPLCVENSPTSCVESLLLSSRSKAASCDTRKWPEEDNTYESQKIHPHQSVAGLLAGVLLLGLVSAEAGGDRSSPNRHARDLDDLQNECVCVMQGNLISDPPFLHTAKRRTSSSSMRMFAFCVLCEVCPTHRGYGWPLC